MRTSPGERHWRRATKQGEERSVSVAFEAEKMEAKSGRAFARGTLKLKR